MERFQLLLGVNNWACSRDQYYDLESGRRETTRIMTLQCFWNSDLEFRINGQRFHEPVNLHVRIGEPIPFPVPKDLEYIGNHYTVVSQLGVARYHPKMVDGDSGNEHTGFLDIWLLVLPELFGELMEARYELKTLHLDVIGEKVHFSWDADPSWEYGNAAENSLYVLGFGYVTGPRSRPKDQVTTA